MKETVKRRTNFYFIIAIVLAIVTPISVYYSVQPKDLTTWSMVFKIGLDSLKNPYVVFTILISIHNAVINFTTKGITDKIKEV